MNGHEHAGHRQRLKNRYLKEGLDSFEMHEVLELLLYYAIPRRDCNSTAHHLLSEFKSISNVLDTDVERLSKVDGIGENSAILLSLIPKIAKIYLQEKWSMDNKDTLGSFETIGRYAIGMFIGKKNEEFGIICLDSNRKVHYSGIVQKGSINETPAYPRLVVDAALRANAQTVVLCHNHPSGSILPSVADKEATEAIVNALEAISIDVLDHVIVSGDRFYSMAEMGQL